MRMNNYILRIATRNIIKDWGASSINILGLVLGLTCFIIILIHVNAELGYDQFHRKGDRIYRLNIKQVADEGKVEIYAISPGGWANNIQSSFPKIESFVRVYKSRIEVIVDNSGKRFYEKNFYWADPEVLNVFSFSLVEGNYPSALAQPNSAIISEKASRKYFGNDNPIGKVLKYTDTEGQCDLIVTGVFSNPPSNIHFNPEFIGSLSSLKNKVKNDDEDLLESQRNKLVHTYFLLSPGVNPTDLELDIQKFTEKRENKDAKLIPQLQALAAIHFSEGIRWEFEPSGQISSIYLLSFISGLILLVASINFMSLASAQAESKIRGINTRRILGATRISLMQASWTEAFLLALGSIILSILLIELILPTINNYLQKDYGLVYFGEGSHLLYIITITLLVAFIVGSYPAIFSSGIGLVNSSHGRRGTTNKGVSFRRVLVVLQFGISALLIITTIFINRQLHFIQNEDLGFARNLVLNIPTRGEETGPNFQRFRDQIIRQHEVVNASGSFHQPFESAWNDLTFKSKELLGDKSFICDQFNATDGFEETFQLQLMAGRNFTQSDTGKFLMNESAVRSLGIKNEDAVGMEIEDVDLFHAPGKVIGVVRDFHYQSLHKAVKPLVIWDMPYWPNYMSIRINTNDIKSTLSSIEQTWNEINPHTPFSYTFLDQDLDRLYLQEQMLNAIFKVLATIAIFIACMGLFALSRITIQKRIKEIGIRKILGAELMQLMFLLWKEYFVLIGASVIVFSPLTYLLVFNWLQKFAYRIEIQFGTFALVSIGLLILSIFTVGYQIAKAAIKNPTEALRHD